MADGYHYKRMVLRDTAHQPGPAGGVVLLGSDVDNPLHRVELIARAGRWPLLDSNEDAPDASYRCFRMWGAAPGLWMKYLEDVVSRTSVLVMFGEDLFQVEELSRRVLLLFQLHPYSREELLSGPGQTEGREKARAILRVALAMGEDFDPELFGVISDASRDPDPQVRSAAAWSTVHLECAQSVAMLSDIAQNDPDEAVRNSAAEMLTEFQRGNQE
ncbi:HEAT repeat domain-containing protein [Micromonospora sp. NPDC047670]|uniref:HEAT repeat domain-containing protein n=1 Tax=Micromonospora sp. NPDC047670 TaxID=3364252 RepID=UPI0037189DC7